MTFFDITRQKRVESEVREMNRLVEAERARLEEVLEHMQTAVLLAEASSGRILTANQRLREILQEEFTLDAPLDANALASSAFHLDGTPYAPDQWPFTRAARDGEVVRDEAMAFTRRDGERVTLLVSAAPLSSSGDDPDTVIMAMTDISERRKMEEELQVAKEAAERANLAQVAFMATVSHELRTPLNSILGYADLLLLTGKIGEPETEKLERIKVASRHLAMMIEEILVFERLEEGDVSSRTGAVDACDVAREAAALVEPAALDQGLVLHLDLPEEGIELMTDGGKVRQVLVNLMGNAIRFTDEGEIRLSLRTEGYRVLFKVRDAGIGIAPESRERIFDRFWQGGEEGSMRRGGGVGIGLSVARRLSRLLGGDVEVESELGRGSTFTLWLPMSAPLD